MKKQPIYRCSLCNQLKNEKTNIVWKNWCENTAPEATSIVGICRKCNAEMRKAGIEGVLQYKHRQQGFVVITVEGYPETFEFETTCPLPKFYYGCTQRHVLLVNAMKDQKVKSPNHDYRDYVIETIESDGSGNETWHLGS